jgi:integrase
LLLHYKNNRYPDAIAIIDNLQGVHHAIGTLIYGAGFRISEVLKLRIKDVDFSLSTIFIFRSKGQIDPITLFPELVKDAIAKQIQKVECIHQKDIDDGYRLTSLPPSLLRKYGAISRWM